MGNRDTQLALPKNELYYWDDNEKVLKPLVSTDGLVKVSIGNIDENTGVNINTVAVSPLVTLQNSASAIGVGSVIPTVGYGVVSLAISGTFVGTITFEGQAPDNNWYAINALQRGTGLIGSTATTTGLFEINVRGLNAIRTNITYYKSGNITVIGQAQALSTGGDMVQITNPDTNPASIKVASSNIIQPIDIQNHLQTTIQTHNAVSVGVSGTSTNTSWIDCDGFTDLAFTILNDANTTNSVWVLWSNDGANQHGYENPLTSSARQYGTGVTPVKARYAKLQVVNGDSALAHTMSAWIFLKA